MNLNPWISTILACCSILCATSSSQAQSYPTKPIKVIVPYPAGGALDSVTRAIGERVRNTLGQSWIIENKSGAGGSVGLQACAAAEPDGYTFCALASESLAIMPHYDPVIYARYNTLVPVTEFARTTGLLYTNSSFPADNLRAAVDIVRKTPGEVRYASFGPGSLPQFIYEWVNKTEKVDFQHIPYKGAQDALKDVLAGRTQLSFLTVGLLLPHIKSGAIRPIAIIGKETSPLLPNIPTMNQLGFEFPEMSIWFGMMAPKGTPKEAREKVADAVRIALNDAELRAQFLDPQGWRPVGSTPSEFEEAIKSQYEQGAQLIKQTGIRAQ